MSVPAMIAHLLLERLPRRPLPRVPEAQAVMEAPEQIAAFMESGRDEGMLAHVYFFHALMSLPVIRPGDTVLDLACGPANQLLHIARLHPDVHFIGLDASPGMLAQASATLASEGVANVTLQQGDMTRLDGIATGSIDGVLCTMSLHHLPDVQALEQTMLELRRILKADGGVYLADFGRLKRRATQRYFAYDRAAEQSAQFTEDFLNSMRAAFSIGELSAAAKRLGLPIEHYHTALAPFMTVLRSSVRRTVDAAIAGRVRQCYRALSPVQQRDFDNLARWFRAGGLALPCSP
jgi:ubiquinone/menaquinone biosynthesis C-methylase UbiE